MYGINDLNVTYFPDSQKELHKWVIRTENLVLVSDLSVDIKELLKQEMHLSLH